MQVLLWWRHGCERGAVPLWPALLLTRNAAVHSRRRLTHRLRAEDLRHVVTCDDVTAFAWLLVVRRCAGETVVQRHTCMSTSVWRTSTSSCGSSPAMGEPVRLRTLSMPDMKDVSPISSIL